LSFSAILYVDSVLKVELFCFYFLIFLQQQAAAGTGSQPSSTAVSAAASATPAIPATAVEDPHTLNEAKMREQLLKKQKELLELQQKKLELELLQTKARLEEQQKQLERQTGHLQTEQVQVRGSANCMHMMVYPKVSGLAARSENCEWYSSLPLGAIVSLFCESV